jgi:hypothetical protein
MFTCATGSLFDKSSDGLLIDDFGSFQIAVVGRIQEVGVDK